MRALLATPNPCPAPTRRAILSAAVAVPMATIAPPAPATPFDPSTSSDAPLWRLWNRVVELDARHAAARIEAETADATGLASAVLNADATMERLSGRTIRLLRRVAATPAQTPFGALIKLRAWRLQTLDWNGPFADLTDPANQAALSALAALEAMFEEQSSID